MMTSEINPRFRRAIPAILDELALVDFRVEPQLEAAKDAVAAALDYVEFEIEKSQVKIKNLRMDSTADRATIEAEQERLRTMLYAKQTFMPDNVMSSVVFLGGIMDFLRELSVESHSVEPP